MFLLKKPRMYKKYLFPSVIIYKLPSNKTKEQGTKQSGSVSTQNFINDRSIPKDQGTTYIQEGLIRTGWYYAIIETTTTIRKYSPIPGRCISTCHICHVIFSLLCDNKTGKITIYFDLKLHTSMFF